jgi:hypothetical protein
MAIGLCCSDFGHPIQLPAGSVMPYWHAPENLSHTEPDNPGESQRFGVASPLFLTLNKNALVSAQNRVVFAVRERTDTTTL